MRLIQKTIESSTIRYKREIWGGIRKFGPRMDDFIYEGSLATFNDIIAQEPKLLPCLIEWEDLNGVKHNEEISIV